MLSSDQLGRGKMSIAVNLKKKEGVAVVRKLCNNADVLIEPYRTGKFTGGKFYCCRVCCFLLSNFFWFKESAASIPLGVIWWIKKDKANGLFFSWLESVL